MYWVLNSHVYLGPVIYMSPAFIWINTVYALVQWSCILCCIIQRFTNPMQLCMDLKIFGLFVNFTMDSPKFIVNEFLQLRLHQIPVWSLHTLWLIVRLESILGAVFLLITFTVLPYFNCWVNCFMLTWSDHHLCATMEFIIIIITSSYKAC